MAKKINSPDLKLIKNRQRQILFGGGFLLIAFLLAISFSSYLINWKSDFSTLGAISDKTIEAKNLLNKLGAYVSHFFMYKGVGLSAYLFCYLLGITGYKLFFQGTTDKLIIIWGWGLAHILWSTIVLGYVLVDSPFLSGIVGYEINTFLTIYIGRLGLFGVLLFFFLSFIVIEFKWTPEKLKIWWKKINQQKEKRNTFENEKEKSVDFDIESTFNQTHQAKELELKSNQIEQKESEEILIKTSIEKEEIKMEIETSEEEDTVDEKLAKKLVEKQGFFDPTLELSNFRMPNLDLLKDYKDSGITINQEELEVNKNKIVDTLNNYKISIANIKTTIGPTVKL